MDTAHTPPPAHVLELFQVPDGPPSLLGPQWDYGWLISDTVISRATALSQWSAKIRERLEIPQVRISRPLWTTDGRLSVAGWRATAHIAGEPQRRIDELVQVALRCEQALAGLTPPPERDDLFARAEAAAFEESSPYYRPLSAPLVLGHADILGTTIFYGSNPPALTDIVPTAQLRPAGFSAALVIVDGLIAGAVDEGICERFAHIPDINQLLVRAVAYRRHINNTHPAAKTTTRAYIEAVEQLLVSRLSDTLEE